MKKLIKILFVLLYDDRVIYIIAGCCAAAVNIGVFALLISTTNISNEISNVISISLAMIFAFFTNKIFVFKSKSKSYEQNMKEFFAFISGRLFTMAIEVGGVWMLCDILYLNVMLSKFMIQFAVLMANYFISKFLVFNKWE